MVQVDAGSSCVGSHDAKGNIPHTRNRSSTLTNSIYAGFREDWDWDSSACLTCEASMRRGLGCAVKGQQGCPAFLFQPS
jgi:hypothetical protein